MEFDDDEPALRRLEYRKLERLGSGAFGDVWRCADANLRRNVAVKSLRADPTEDETRDFKYEAVTTARLDHPNIVPVHDLGVDGDNRLAYSMKQVRGRTLTEVVTTATDWPSRAYFVRTVTALIRIADALAFAHDRGILHSDVKPDNILLGEFGETYLLDWGLAVPMDPAAGVAPVVAKGGTPNFMSPEQMFSPDAEDGVSVRTDVFGLGATLYFVLTRRPPFRAGRSDALSAEAPESEGTCVDPALLHPDVALPIALCAAARRAMAPNPDDRHPSPLELAADLQQYLHADERVSVRTVSAGTHLVLEGDPATGAYRILVGTCEVTRAGRRVRTLGAGELFGEMASFGRTTRSATVTAITDVTVEVMDAADVERWLDSDLWLAPFVRSLTQRFLDLERERDALALRLASLEQSRDKT